MVAVITIAVELITATEFAFVMKVIGTIIVVNEVRKSAVRLMEAFIENAISKIIDVLILQLQENLSEKSQVFVVRLWDQS